MSTGNPDLEPLRFPAPSRSRSRVGLTLRDHAAATICVMVAMGMPAATATAAPPVGDNFLSAVSINRGGTEMPRERVDFTVDTAEATVQSDLFNPPRSGGPPEPTACRSSGRT